MTAPPPPCAGSASTQRAPQGFAITNAGLPGRLTIQGSILSGASGSVRNLSPYEVRLGASQLLGPDREQRSRGSSAAPRSTTPTPWSCPPTARPRGPASTPTATASSRLRPGCGRAPFDCRDDVATTYPGAPEICRRRSRQRLRRRRRRGLPDCGNPGACCRRRQLRNGRRRRQRDAKLPRRRTSACLPRGPS